MNTQDEVDRLHASIPAIRGARSTDYLFATRKRCEHLLAESVMDLTGRAKLASVILAVDERLHELDREVRREWEAPDA